MWSYLAVCPVRGVGRESRHGSIPSKLTDKSFPFKFLSSHLELLEVSELLCTK